MGTLHQHIVDSATDFAIVATDQAGLVTSWNQGAARTLGWTQAEVIGRDLQGLINPDPAPRPSGPAIMTEGAANRRGLNGRWYVRKDGQRLWATGETTILRDSTDAAIGFVQILRDRTEHRAQARALQDNRDYIGFLLNASAEAFYAVDPDGVTTLCNTTFIRMMGFANEADAIGRKLHDVIHHTHPGGRHYDVADCPIYRCAATGTPAYVTDELFYRLDGTPIPVEYWARPIIVDGEHRGAICTFLDVSAKRDAETARQAVEDQLRALNADLERQVQERSSERETTWQVSPHLLSVIDLANGRFIRVNPAWTATFGFPEQAYTGASYAEFVHPDDIDAAADAWQGLLVGQPVLNFENRYRTTGGAYRWLSWVTVPENGKLYSTARDVTAEKEQARLVEIRTAERDQLWNSSEDLLVVADYAGKLVRTNPSWTRLLGYSEAELLAGTYDEIIHPEDLPHVRTGLAAMRDSGKPVQFEDRVQAKDGTWKRILWTLSPDTDGRQLTGVGHDITVQREMEERLRQSQKMEAVGQLTGGLAHDFNNLLTGISGSLEMLQTRAAQGNLAAIERYVTAAQGAAKRAAALTHRLLAFSRRQTLDPRSTDVNRLVADMGELVRRTAGPQIHVEIVGAGGLWPTLVDPNQLENALLNLCINARDAMPDGGRLTIETANKWLDDKAAADRELPPGQYVSLCVTDTGIGMTPEVAMRAFDPFFTTKPLGQGTGLGLSMIYGFARQSGGQVRIYSELDQGTTMCLYLPRDHSASPNHAIEPLPAELVPQGVGEIVLVVDDEPTIRMLIAEVLSGFGYGAIEAADGPAGLKVIQSSVRIDLLITDVGLPGGMNGRQVADAARVLRPGLKVLFITGYADNAVIGDGRLDPGMQVLTKPFAMDVLARRIRGIIEG